MEKVMTLELGKRGAVDIANATYIDLVLAGDGSLGIEREEGHGDYGFIRYTAEGEKGNSRLQKWIDSLECYPVLHNETYLG